MSSHHLPTDEVNAVLTFVDAVDGRRWLAGAILGPLMLEGDTDVQMDVAETIDRALTLTSFKVIDRSPVQCPPSELEN